ncbi:MAG: glycosyltransferase family 2 protein [Candidatus Tritonobacter lacicola]|nr:glycosyltransferase family 2 protein [Candidatus Tritonobacter lacicola]
MKFSVVIPVYNGEKTIAGLVDELVRVLSRDELEIVLVNDGSSDNSHEECVSIFERYRNTVKYICLARNFGEHNAVLAGLNMAAGDYAVIVDDDFQNPPEEIRKLIDEAVSKKYDVVYSYYSRKHHSWFRNLGSRFDNLVAGYLLNKPKGLYLSSFKCLNRFIVREIIKYKGPYPYIDGLILRATGNIGKVLTRHAERREGRSGYTLRKLVHLWLNMFVNFSVFPLRFSAILGFIFSLLGGILSVVFIIEKIVNPEVPVGLTAILVSILIFAGIQLIMLGLIGEYLGKLFLSYNQTPQYVVRRVFDGETGREKA